MAPRAKKSETVEGKLAAARKLFAEGKMTPGRAQKLRTLGAELCGCQLCQWAINPATSIRMHEERMTLAGELNTRGGWMPHRAWAELLASPVVETFRRAA